MKRFLFVALLFGSFVHCASAQDVLRADPEVYVNLGKSQTVPPSLRLPAGEAVRTTAILLDVVKAYERKALDDFNSREHSKLRQIGFQRLLSEGTNAGISAYNLNWTSVPGGGQATRFSTTSPEAAALRLGLALRRMDDGVELRFFGSANPSRIYGPSTNQDIDTSQSLYWTPVIEGETLTTEIYLPPGLTPDSVIIGLPEVSHLVATVTTLKALGDAGACEHDLACVSNPSPALLSTAKTVAKMVFTESGSSYTCTGTLLNDTDTSTFIPYFYTANHCIDSQAKASTLNTYWFFEATTCGGASAPNTVQRSGGATLLYHDAALDAALLRLADSPPNGVFFAGWDAGTVAAGTNVTGIHHPEGDLKKVSLGTVTGFGTMHGAGSFIATTWSYGITEVGSSGSGLFSFDGATYRLRGGLYGGSSSCTNPTGADKYSRLDQVYPFIKQYLNPSAPTCNPTISPTSQAAAAGGLSASANVTNSAGCAWTATSNVPWITVTAGSSGSGNGVANYVVAANTGTSARTGTLTVAGGTVTVTQAGASTTSVLANPGFEGGAATWTQTSSGGFAIIMNGTTGVLPHAGSWYAWLGGYESGTDAISQIVAIPGTAQKAYLRFWYSIATNEISSSVAYDTMDVEVYSAATGTKLATLARFSNLNGTPGWVQSAQFDVTPFKGQTIRLQFTAKNDVSAVTNFRVDDVSIVTVAPVSYQGLWWNAQESGWGINFTHQGDVIFATWFTFGADKQPQWFTMVARNTPAEPNVYTAAISSFTGPPFNTEPFPPNANARTQVGNGKLTFTADGTSATFAYTVNGISQTKQIVPQELFPGQGLLPVCTFGTALADLPRATNYQSLWWATHGSDLGGDESGWGINFTHHGTVIFATWFTYDMNGKGLWLFSVASQTSPGVYSGTVRTAAGPAFSAKPWDANAVVRPTVGNATIRFFDGNDATFSYTVNGVAQTKTLVRQLFDGATGTVCN